MSSHSANARHSTHTTTDGSACGARGGTLAVWGSGGMQTRPGHTRGMAGWGCGRIDGRSKHDKSQPAAVRRSRRGRDVGWMGPSAIHN